MNNNLTTVVVLVTIIHVAALAVMIWIRVRKTAGDGIVIKEPAITPCAVCGAPGTHRDYDGLDPNERRDPRTGQAWSADVTHYLPLCDAHRIQPATG